MADVLAGPGFPLEPNHDVLIFKLFQGIHRQVEGFLETSPDENIKEKLQAAKDAIGYNKEAYTALLEALKANGSPDLKYRIKELKDAIESCCD